MLIGVDTKQLNIPADVSINLITRSSWNIYAQNMRLISLLITAETQLYI